MSHSIITTPPSRNACLGDLKFESDLVASRLYANWLNGPAPSQTEGVVLERALVKNYITLWESSAIDHTFSKLDIRRCFHGWDDLMQKTGLTLLNLKGLAVKEWFPQEQDLDISLPQTNFITLFQKVISQFEFFYRLDIECTRKFRKEKKKCAKMRSILCLPTCGISCMCDGCCWKGDYEHKYVRTFFDDITLNRVAFQDRLLELVSSAVQDFIIQPKTPSFDDFSVPNGSAECGKGQMPAPVLCPASAMCADLETGAMASTIALQALEKIDLENDLPSYESATNTSSFA